MRKLLILGLLTAFTLLGEAAGGSGEPTREIANSTFKQGEFLKYRVHYGLITAGSATLSVAPEPEIIDGRECYHIVGEGVTAPMFDLVFKVRDKYETYLDKENLVSLKFKRKIEEGHFKEYSETSFDQKNRKAYFKKNHWKPVAYDVPANIQDVLSAFYFARTKDYSKMKPGDQFTFRNFIDQKVHDLGIEYAGTEVIQVEGTKYNTIKLQPLVQEEGVFQHDGTLAIWISDDENHIPIRIQSSVIVGSVKVDLLKASGLVHPFDAKIE